MLIVPNATATVKITPLGQVEQLDVTASGLSGIDQPQMRRLKRAGDVKILAYTSSTSYALGHAEGPTRVAWTIVNRQLPVVQCVQVERTGNVLTGSTINLRRLSVPIDRIGTC